MTFLLLFLTELRLFRPIVSVDYELTKYLYTTLFSRIKKDMSGSERTEVEKCIRRCCDMYNIKICYRLKGLFKMSTEDVVAHTLPFCDRFDKRQWNRY
ncbi:MAG: V-type ATPase subunit [[Eubacterium] siraeum]